jgi:hypothetical protein
MKKQEIEICWQIAIGKDSKYALETFNNSTGTVLPTIGTILIF